MRIFWGYENFVTKCNKGDMYSNCIFATVNTFDTF